MNPNDFIRLANNFYNSKDLESDISRINVDLEFNNYIIEQQNLPQFKVALVFICLNPLYWEFAPEMVKGAKQFFLPGHQTDFFFWTDIPEKDEDIRQRMTEEFKKILQQLGANPNDSNLLYQDVTIKGRQMNLQNIIKSVVELRKISGVNIIPTESTEWPMPTLLRYHLFLQQEEKLKDYDYIAYCDIDMKWVGICGDEILPKNGLFAAPHPGYWLRKEYYPPYEPNELSTAYIKRPGRITQEKGKPRFRPEYYAGGFQGGKSGPYIEAMKRMKERIDKDFKNGYTAVWNDESHWNFELSENPPEIMLTPSYIYPDSLINEYYVPLWGKNYQPKLITITKWFSLSPEGGQAVQDMTKK